MERDLEFALLDKTAQKMNKKWVAFFVNTWPFQTVKVYLQCLCFQLFSESLVKQVLPVSETESN